MAGETKRRLTYVAKFSDGGTLTRGSHREYSHAWNVTCRDTRYPAERPYSEAQGLARTEEMAHRAAKSEANFRLKHRPHIEMVGIEVVPVTVWED